MAEEIPQENLGVIEGSGTNNLWIGGTISYEIVNPTGDWRGYLPKEEHQFSNNADTMGCVSFSFNNDMEIQTKFRTGVELNYSDRFLAKMSGTTPQGNYLDKVAETARTIGLVLEEQWPEPSNYTWNSYYAAIPQDIIDAAVKLDIAYELTSINKNNLISQLKQCPIQVTIPSPHPNHAVVLVHIEGDNAYYFDTYPPYLKTINVSLISYALKIVQKGSMAKFLKLQDGTKQGILIVDGFTASGLFADDADTYKNLLEAYPQISDATPTLSIPQ